MKKFISLLLCILTLTMMFPLNSFTIYTNADTNIVESNSTINVGNCITLGTYNGKPIVWRCVDIDENGPLMLSEDVLCTKEYDAAGKNTNYHTDGWSNSVRSKYGSNCWSDSNIRQWLNSSGIVTYTHCPPSYADELGFLTNFTMGEMALVKTVTQKTYVNEWEKHRSGYVDGGSKEATHINYISKLNGSTESFWYQNVTDQFFLLDRTQLYNIYENNLEYLYSDELYYTRYIGNSGACYERVFRIGNEDYIVTDYACVQQGIRPAFYLNMDNYGEEPQMSDQDKYLKQHIDFVNSATFNTASNDFRYATTLWTNYHGSTSQAAGEFVYDIQEGFFETISFQGMSSLENPYDAIILDLLSSKSVKASLSDAVDSSAISVIDSVIGDLITTFQADSDWANDIDIAGNFKDLLDLEATDYSSNKLYKSLDKLFDGKSKDQINSIFKKYDCYSNILANVSDAAKGVDYFLAILKYTASIEAYYSASKEFKAILKEVADVMPSVNADYGQKFNETYNNYSSCIDYNSVMQNVLNHTTEEGFWLITDLMSDVLQDSALTFCKTSLKMSESAAGNLVAALWAAETGFNLGDMITENDTLINCRRLLRANYMLDEAVHHVMCSHASTLKSNPSYDEAVYFDAAFNLFKNLQISSLELHQKYMKTNGSSFINFLAGKQDFFKREAEAQAVIINTWKNIKCHDDNLVDSITYSKTNTVVVACPTNVYVYRKSDGELIASVVNNEVYNTDYALTVITESNEKAICLPNLNDYEIKIEATDDGSMEVDYTISSPERAHYDRAVCFNNVEIKNQGTFDFQVDSVNNISLVDQDQNIVWPNLDTADLTFEGVSLSLQDSLTINCKVDKALFEENGYTDPYVVFNFNGADFAVYEYSATDMLYSFAFEDIAATQMNETVYGTLFATYNDIEYASTTISFTVRQYCDAILSDETHSDYYALVKEMLNYGAMAQMYFDYDTGYLANDGITGVANAEIPENTEEMTVNDKISGLSFYGASLVYRDRIAVRYYFTGDVTGCAFTANGNTYTPAPKDGMYYVEVADILPQDLDQQITLTVTDASGNIMTVTYGPMNYIVRMNEKGSDTLKALVKALYNYHLAAKALTA